MELVESKTGKVVFARLFEGEDLLNAATQAAEKTGISVGFFYVIGTLKQARMGFYQNRKYETIEMKQPLEIVSCLGNISIKEGKAFAHAHITVSDEEGKVFGGHVMSDCVIGITADLVLVEAVGVNLVRMYDEKSNLFLWSLPKS